MANLKSAIKAPENAMLLGLAEAAAVFAVYQHAVPNQTDIRSADPHNIDVEAARKRAAWVSAAIIGLTYVITRDLNSVLIGGAALAGMDMMVKHANGVNPSTGKLAGAAPPAAVDNDVAFPLPDYADATPDDGGY